jgi:hypothetical protein
MVVMMCVMENLRFVAKTPQRNVIVQCFSTFVRPRPGKFFFYKTRARAPPNLLVNTFPIFLSSYIKLA